MAAVIEIRKPGLEGVALRINGISCLTHLLRERAERIDGNKYKAEVDLAMISGSLSVLEGLLSECEEEIDQAPGRDPTLTILSVMHTSDVAGVICDCTRELTDDKGSQELEELHGAMRAIVHELRGCLKLLEDAIREAA